MVKDQNLDRIIRVNQYILFNKLKMYNFSSLFELKLIRLITVYINNFFKNKIVVYSTLEQKLPIQANLKESYFEKYRYSYEIRCIG